MPPTATELKLRLERRAEDTAEIIARRLKNAARNPALAEYDYVLVNRDLDKSFARLRGILTAERLKRVRKEDIQEFVDNLLARPENADALIEAGLAVHRFVACVPAEQNLPLEYPRHDPSVRCRRLQAMAGDQASVTSGFDAASCAAVRKRLRPPRPRMRRSHGSGDGRGTNSTTDEVTFGGGTKADGAMSNWIFGCVRHWVRIDNRP